MTGATVIVAVLQNLEARCRRCSLGLGVFGWRWQSVEDDATVILTASSPRGGYLFTHALANWGAHSRERESLHRGNYFFPPLQHAVNHLTGDAEIIRRVDKFFQLLAVDVLTDLLILDQQVDQRSSRFHNLATDVVDEVVRLVAAEVRAEPHHYGFGHNESLRDVEIFAHLLLVDLQAFGQETGLRQRPGREHENFR